MENSKTFLAIAPIVALVVAVAFLHGYWSFYDILIFPYLTFSEIVAYAAAPLFGFLVFIAIGMFFGVVSALTKDRKPISKVREVLEFLVAGAIIFLLIYFGLPEKWLFVPLVVFALISLHFLDNNFIRQHFKASPRVYLLVLLAIYFVIGSFGYGRYQAEKLRQNKVANVQVNIEGNLANTRLLGKINGYYFFLDMDGRVNQYPETSIKQITYQKLY
ncbi:MAG: hypothetical protein WCB36_01380 [Burkholderiales bacterium]